VKYLVDNQLPAALARFLVSRGAECQHVSDVGLADARDAEIWNYANSNHLVVISKDEDFLYWAKTPGATARFVWIRFGNCRTTFLLAAMGGLWVNVETRLKAGDRVIELRLESLRVFLRT
jgi:predicted nuclease of predicted toxin-antitoxin system